MYKCFKFINFCSVVIHSKSNSQKKEEEVEKIEI